MDAEARVYVVDDDPAVRQGIVVLLESAGYVVWAFDSAESFLCGYRHHVPACLITDIRMPGMDGLELQQRLLCEERTAPPVIVLSGHADVPAAVRALKAGAVDFIEKPFQPSVLVARVSEALADHARRYERDASAAAVERRVAELTGREREVLDRVVAGDSNKVIAATLRISERTVEVHRARMMQKMGSRSVAELARMVYALRGGRGEPLR